MPETEQLRPVIEDPTGTLSNRVAAYATKHGLTKRRAWATLLQQALAMQDSYYCTGCAATFHGFDSASDVSCNPCDVHDRSHSIESFASYFKRTSDIGVGGDTDA
jgi:hypothetical protein